MKREPVVAGQFYADEKDELIEQIESCFLDKRFGPGKTPEVKSVVDRKIVGVIVPHAGYTFSGAVAANSYYALAEDGMPESFVIIGPNHTGFGHAVSIMKEGVWETPLGEVEIDKSLAKEIKSEVIVDDFSAHQSEHSIEVQLPFLQYVFKKVKFVPICMLDQSYETCEKVSKVLGKVLKGKNSVVIASSDLTHFESNEAAHKKDKAILDEIEKMSVKGVFDKLRYLNSSTCGYGPIATMLLTTKLLGAKKTEVLKYATSGDICGEKNSVVGYSAVKVTK